MISIRCKYLTNRCSTVVTEESCNKRATVIAAQQQLNLITLCSCRCPGHSPGTFLIHPNHPMTSSPPSASPPRPFGGTA